MNELQAMRTFARIVDSGGFAAAARSLDASPAVVTRQLADLESHLGTRLLTRTTRRVALTELGTGYLTHVRRILHEVDEATALARQAQAEPCGVVRVVVPPAFAAHQLAPRLARFQTRHPQVSVNVTATGPVESLDLGHDISIVVRQPLLDGDFVARRLARSEVIACAAPGYLARHGRPQHPQELAEHQLLLPSTERALTFCRLGPAEATELEGPFTVAPSRLPLGGLNPDLQQAVTLAGIGIAGLPSFSAGQALQDHSLERVLPGWRLHDLSIWACMPSRRHVPASTRAFLDFLVEEFGGDDEDPWMPERDAGGSACRRAAQTVH